MTAAAMLIWYGRHRHTFTPAFDSIAQRALIALEIRGTPAFRHSRAVRRQVLTDLTAFAEAAQRQPVQSDIGR